MGCLYDVCLYLFLVFIRYIGLFIEVDEINFFSLFLLVFLLFGVCVGKGVKQVGVVLYFGYEGVVFVIYGVYEYCFGVLIIGDYDLEMLSLLGLVLFQERDQLIQVLFEVVGFLFMWLSLLYMDRKCMMV